MVCLPISLRTVLPTWIRSFFLGNDDTSFWGGDEELSAYENSSEAIPDITSTYAPTEAAVYRLDELNSTGDFKDSKQIGTKPRTGQFAGEFVFQTRMIETVS